MESCPLEGQSIPGHGDAQESYSGKKPCKAINLDEAESFSTVVLAAILSDEGPSQI